ncbi:MAG: DUF445 domain-containing protein [Bacillota bacterium]
MTLLNLIFNILAGAATGYITNDIAVKMLFRKVGPFGGVLEKTREEFILNLSDLVEREIINHDTLAGELNNPEFKDEMAHLIEEILKDELPAYLKKLKLKDIHKIEDSIEGLSDLVSNPVLLADLLENFAEKIKLSDFISKSQLTHIFETLFPKIIDIIGSQEMNKDLLKLLEEFQTEMISEREEKDIYYKFIRDIQTELDENKQDITKNFSQLISYIGFNDYIQEMIQNVYDEPLNKLLNSEDNNIDLARKLYDFMAGSAGQELGPEFLKAVFDSLERIELTFPELFGERWNDEIVDLLAEQLPELIYNFLNWLQDHRDELEVLVDEAIGEVLAQGSGLRNNLKQLLYKVLAGDVASRYGLIGRLFSAIAEGEKLNELAYDLAENIKDLLEKRELGWYVSRLKRTGAGDPQDIYNLILHIYESWLKTSESKNIFSSFSLSDIFGPAPLKLLLVESKNFMANLLTNFILSSAAADLSSAWLVGEDKFKKITIFIQEIEKKDINISSIPQDLISVLYNWIAPTSLHKILPQSIYTITSERISLYLKPKLVDEFNKYKDVNGDFIITRLVNNLDYSNLAVKITDSLLSITNENLNQLLEGKVSEVVSDNLLELSAEDMRRVVESFMGHELKPLSYFGGMLGAIAGLLLEVGGGGIISSSGLPPILPAMLVFGLVGYLTNVIAIWMIFKPYRPIKIGGKTLPFTPGLFARNQKRFANALGNFVQDELLDPYRISRLLKEQSNQFKQMLHTDLMSNDYRRLRAIIRTISDTLGRYITEAGLKLLSSNSELLVTKTMTKVDELKLKPEQIVEAGDIFAQNLTKDFAEVSGVISEGCLKLFEEKKSLHSLLPVDTYNIFKDNIAQSLSKYSLEKFKLFIENNQKKGLDSVRTGDLIENLYRKYLAEERIKDVLSFRARRKFSDFLIDYMLNLVRSGGLTKLLLKIQEVQNQAESTSNEWLSKIENIFALEYSYFQDFLLENIIKLLKSYREPIKKMATELVENEIIGGTDSDGWFSQTFFRSAYKLSGSRETVSELVDLLIDEKLPVFIFQHQQELESELRPVLLRGAQKITKNYWALTEPEDWQPLLDSLFVHPELADSFSNFISGLVESSWNIKLPNSEAISLRKLELFSSKRKLYPKLIGNVKENQGIIKVNLINLFNVTFDSTIIAHSPSDVIKLILGNKISFQSDLKNKINNFFQTEQDTLYQIFKDLICQLAYLPELQNPHKIINKDQLNKDISYLINYLARESEIREYIKPIMQDYIFKNSAKLDAYIHPKTVDHLLDIFLQAGLSGLNNHMHPLLRTVAIKDIAVKQVELMEPEAIEDLFTSFAGSYLNKLKFYGWSGSIFGLIAELLTGI